MSGEYVDIPQILQICFKQEFKKVKWNLLSEYLFVAMHLITKADIWNSWDDISFEERKNNCKF